MSREVEHVLNDAPEAQTLGQQQPAVSLHAFGVESLVGEQLGEHADRRDRRLQLVRYVREQLLPRARESPRPPRRENEHEAATERRDGEQADESALAP